MLQPIQLGPDVLNSRRSTDGLLEANEGSLYVEYAGFRAPARTAPARRRWSSPDFIDVRTRLLYHENAVRWEWILRRVRLTVRFRHE